MHITERLGLDTGRPVTAYEGELLAAFVVVRPGSTPTVEELVAHCKAVASRYKVPDYIEIRDALPVTATGKLMRRDLKQLAADLTVVR